MSASNWPHKVGHRKVQQLRLLALPCNIQYSAQAKVPVGDGPYVRAKQIQLLEKDPERAIALFWAAINEGDRVDSALKDMAVVMKQQNRGEEAIQAILSFRHLCSPLAQESLDNVLLDLYKKCGRLDEQIDLLKHKLGLIHKGMVFNGKRTKTARSQGRKFQISILQEATRLLGNLGWAYMQLCNYVAAEAVYRKALSIEEDSNKLCNLGVCLLKQGKEKEARGVLDRVTPMSPDGRLDSESHVKSYQRSRALLHELSEKSPSLSANQDQQTLITPQEFDLWTHWRPWETPTISNQDVLNPVGIKNTINVFPNVISTNPPLLPSSPGNPSNQSAGPLLPAPIGSDVDTSLTLGGLATTNCMSTMRYRLGANGSFKREIGPSSTVQQPNKAKKKLDITTIENDNAAKVDTVPMLDKSDWVQSAMRQKPVATKILDKSVSNTANQVTDNNRSCSSQGLAISTSQLVDVKVDVSSLRHEYQDQWASTDTQVLDFSCVDKVLESVVSYVDAPSATETVSTMFMPSDAVANTDCMDTNSVNEGAIEKRHSDIYDHRQGQGASRAPVSMQRLTGLHMGQHRLKVFQDMTHDGAHNL